MREAWCGYLAYISSFGTLPGGGGWVKTKLKLHSSQQSWSWDELGNTSVYVNTAMTTIIMLLRLLICRLKIK